MKRISSRDPFEGLIRMFSVSSATIPYSVYAQVRPAVLIGVAKHRRKYRPGGGLGSVLDYACKIKIPKQGFITSENPAPVILAAIGMVIGQDVLVKALSEVYQMPKDWTTTLAEWKVMLAGPVDASDLKVLLKDLKGCGTYYIANTIEQYCKREGINQC